MAVVSLVKYFSDRVNFETIEKKVDTFIGEFITTNIESIAGDGFSKRITFGDIKKTELTEIYGINEREWKQYANSNPALRYGENAKNLLNNILLIHYIKTKDYNVIKFMAIKLFTSRYYKAFPKYMVEGRMKAVLNGLSNKFFIKKHGSLDKALDALISTYLNTYSDRLKRATDDDIVYLINGLATRIDLSIKNIQRLYYNYTGEDQVTMDSSSSVTLQDLASNTQVFDNIIKGTSHDEMLHGLDITLLKRLDGMEYVPVFKKLISDNASNVSVVIKSIMNDYLKRNNKITVDKMYKEFLRDVITTRSRDPELVKNIDIIGKKIGLEEKDMKKFQDMVIKYYSVKIYKSISDTYHLGG